jgi:hypothetical protein
MIYKNTQINEKCCDRGIILCSKRFNLAATANLLSQRGEFLLREEETERGISSITLDSLNIFNFVFRRRYGMIDDVSRSISSRRDELHPL